MPAARAGERADRGARPSNFLDAHARVREARARFLQYAELRYRQFLSDPQQRPHAVACLYFNDWQACRDRFGLAGLESLNQQVEHRVVPLLGRKDICARFSDSELVLVIVADRDRDGVEERARRLLTAAADGPLDAGQPLDATFSLAMCWFDRRVRSAEDALFDAMHLAELLAHRGDNAFRIYQPDLQPGDTGDAADALERIRSSLQTNHMRLVFQPLLSTEDTQLRYAQVWARLLAADGGEVRARGFIDAARRSGLLARLDRWTLRRTVRMLATDPGACERVRLFVNTALATFDERTMDWLAKTVQRHPGVRDGLIAQFDAFEFASRPDEGERLADALRGLGFELALAQVGADNLPRAGDALSGFGFVRMSARFALEMEDNPALGGALIELVEHAHQHGVRVVMPNLEREEDLVEFWKMGIDLVQGDYIEHPRELLRTALTE